MNTYEYAKIKYKTMGIDTDKAIEKLANIPISMHCWQGDDVGGFDNVGGLSGGIAATGNYPGRARNPAELMNDIDKVFSFVGGAKRLNLHASYAIFENGEFADRDKLLPRHFSKWVEFAKQRGIGLDFNPTLFSHPKAAQLTLSSPDEEIRKFWVRHCISCLKISEYFALELGTPCVMNIWIPDGYKDIPADRISPRARFKKSLDEILESGYDKNLVNVTLESKVFGIGFESYTVPSAEFCLNYAAQNDIMPLMDNGHYHPTELVSDKISSLLLFFSKIALHITRPVRWDSDHVVLFDDETREIAKEIIFSGRVDDIAIALDFFDASINRVSAWTTGMRNMQKALLYALLMPRDEMFQMQNDGNYTELMVTQEEQKCLPFGEVYSEFCHRHGVPSDGEWFSSCKEYEREVLLKRV